MITCLNSDFLCILILFKVLKTNVVGQLGLSLRLFLEGDRINSKKKLILCQEAGL